MVKASYGLSSQQIASFNAGFPSTVYEFVKSGRYPRQGWFRRLTKHDLEHVQRALESVGMWENRHKQIGRLSGGQKQRAVIARIFASDPDILSWMSQRRVWMQGQLILSMNSCTTRLTSMASRS